MRMQVWRSCGLVAVFLVGLLSACSDDGAGPESNEILRFAITMNGFVLTPVGDTVAVENLAAELNIAQPLSGDGPDSNPVEVAIFTPTPPGPGVTGLRLATNTRMTAPNTVAAAGVDEATVLRTTADASVDITMLNGGGGTPCTALPSHNTFSAGEAYKIFSGRVLLDLPAGAVTGSIAINGVTCNGPSMDDNALFTVTFSGNRL